MRRILLSTAAGLGLVLGSIGGSELAAGGDQPRSKLTPIRRPIDKPESTCGSFGTSVEFLSTPSEAARKAKKEEKLVFVLHVSGHFEDPKFT